MQSRLGTDTRVEGVASDPPIDRASHAPAKTGSLVVEAGTHLAFSTGWPDAMSAVTAAKRTLPRMTPTMSSKENTTCVES
jgi:hypothetical protein